MDKDDNTLPMDQTARPELVSEPRIAEPEPEAEEQRKEAPPAKVEVDERESDGSQPRDEHGRFAAKADEKGEKQPEPGTPPEQSQQVPLKALEDERRKRQEAEETAARLQREWEAFRQQQQPQEPPSVWEDETAYGEHWQNSAVQLAALNARLDMSEFLARREHADFDEMKAEFLEMMAQNPALQQQARQAADPWAEAYRIAKNARTMKELGATDLNELLAAKRAEWEKEVAAAAPRPPSFPQSTVQDGTAGPRGPDWANYKPGEPVLPMDKR